MTKAVRIHQTGGPEVLRYEDVEVGQPGPAEALIRQSAIGVNFIDIYYRTGVYTSPLPAVIGLEGAGVVEAVGSEVTHLRPGDRVAYASPPMGGYAERRLIPAARLVKVPDGISDVQAAGMMLKGMTAWYLLRRTYPVAKGDTILIHAAAGGVGTIVCQWAKHLGATVIGTVGSDEKADIARAHGCDHPIVYAREDFVARVREITNGAGVPVVYDSVGQSTFMKSLDCLKSRGLMVSFGQSSGKVPPFDLGILSAKGSLFLTRPMLLAYTRERPELEAAAGELFGVVQDGTVSIKVTNTFSLAEAGKAHSLIESRQTTGSTVLLP